MIAENPSNPRNLVAGGLYQYPSSYNSTQYYRAGVSGVSTSWDGGVTWSTQQLPEASAWSQPSKPQCGHNHLADTAIAFGPNDRVYYLDLSYYIPPPSLSCQGPLAGTGLYVTISTDGGTTWGTPVGVAGTASGGSIDKPWMAVDTTSGNIYVAYTDDANGSVIEFQRSTDGGESWSHSLVISTVSGVTGSMRGVELAVDGFGTIDATWIDQNNAEIFFTRSTDNGTRFSTPTPIATALAEYTSPAPDAFRAYTLPGLGVAPGREPPVGGRVYVTWQNGSGGTAGSPAVALSYSTNNGSTWSRPRVVNSNTALENFQPDVAVTADGTVYVEWYGENPANGFYRLYGAVSRDGGARFDPQVTISDVDSYPHYSSTGGGNAWWIGDYTDALSDGQGVRALWTDARSPRGWSCAPCLWGYVYNISFYTAELTNASFVGSTPANLTVNGTVLNSGRLHIGPAPAYRDWLVGSNYTITAAPVTNETGTLAYFGLWFGNVLTTEPTLAGNVTGPLHLTACYVAAPGAPCHMPGAPGHLSVNVFPANASVLMNGRPFALSSSGHYTNWTYPGPFVFNVSLGGYFPVNRSVSVTPGNFTFVNVTLIRIPGNLVVHVGPAAALLTISPNVTLNSSSGGFYTATLLPRVYNLTSTLYGYTTDQLNVSVRGLRTTFANLTCAPLPGWINGTVIPANAYLTLNGAPITPSSNGEFSLRRVAGSYWLNASATGYAPKSSGPLTIGPFGSVRALLWLPRTSGELWGNVTPSDARVWVDYIPTPVRAGAFNLSLQPGSFPVIAQHSGYAEWRGTVEVTANATSDVEILMGVAGGWLAGSVSPPSATVRVDNLQVPVSADGGVNVSVSIGSHSVTVEAAGYQSSDSVVLVSAGRTSILAIHLTPLASGGSVDLSTWEGVGLGLGGVAVAFVALLLWRRSPPEGRPRPVR